MKLPLAALLLVCATGISAPAAAKSMTSSQIGEVFCIGRLSGDMAPVVGVLTEDLGKLVAARIAKDGPDSVPWQSNPDYAAECDTVGASGTADEVEVVLAYQFRDQTKAGFSDRLVAKFVDERLRIDDIKFPDNTTLRQKLGAN